MAIVWLGHSTFKRKSGGRKPDDHVDEHAHEWLQALFVDRLGEDVERHPFFPLHQVLGYGSRIGTLNPPSSRAPARRSDVSAGSTRLATSRAQCVDQDV